MFGNLIKGLFGNKSDRDVKKMMPLVEEINKLYEQYHSLTDEELKAKGLGFRERIKKEREELIEEHADLSEEEREEIIVEREEEILNEIVPEVFSLW